MPLKLGEAECAGSCFSRTPAPSSICADNRLPPAVQAKILYRSYRYLVQNKMRDNFNEAMVADFNQKLWSETLEEWIKLSNMAGAKVKNTSLQDPELDDLVWTQRACARPSAMPKVAEAQAAFQACQAWVVKEGLTWISFEAGPLPNMQDVQFVPDVKPNIRLPQALRVTVNQYGVKVGAFLLQVWRLLLQYTHLSRRCSSVLKTG